MRKKVITVGTSAGVTISPADLKALGIRVGDPVDVSTHDGVITIRPARNHTPLSHDVVMARIDEEFGG